MKAHLVVALALLSSCGPKSNPVAPPPEWVAPATPALGAPATFAKPSSDPLAEVAPLDPQIKVGKLSNGLTYYVMKHKKPEQRASLWLAVNAGSVQEDDDQKGLAHWVEHMAFNGTKRFPEQAIINYIEKVGMKFGPDVNAYTSFDQTVYMLTVPTDDKQVMHTGLDILRDWAGDVTFDPVEVDKERGVVMEEWRLRRGAFARINDKQWPVILQGSKYGVRLPIGDPKILETAKRDQLVRYYKDWYRPDLMALIAVGDFDPAAMEAEIKAKFGDLTNPKTPRPRTVVPVPHAHDTAVTMATDPEMPFTQVNVYDKMDRRPEATRGDYRRSLVENVYHNMLGARLAELGLEPDAPFTWAGSYTTSFARSSDLFLRGAQAKNGKIMDSLAVLFREIARVEKHGFLASELDRARKSIIANAETSAAEWEKTQGDQIADEMTRHFFEGELMPGRHWELAATRELLATVTLDELNHLARNWGGDKGRVIAISGPSSVKLPSEAEVRQVIAAGSTASVEAWKDGAADRPLIASPPAPGKVVTTTKDDAAGTTVWTLANGVRVVVKPTTFQNDEVSFEGWQLGGSSLVADKDFVHARHAGSIVGESGAGDFEPIALRKALAGKVANVWVSIDELSQNVSGNARPADLETALQLLHLRMTAPRMDDKAFKAWKDDQLEWVRNRKRMPEVNFFDEMTLVNTNNHLRRRPATAESIESIDPAKALAIYKDRFADANGFTFVFVGNIDPAKLQPLVETYLGGLPAKGRKEKWKDIGVKYPTARLQKTITAGSEPKSFVSLTMGTNEKWTRDLERDAKILSMILRIRLREVLREDMGGVYGVQVNAWTEREPKERRGFRIFFGCKPDNVDALKKAAFDEIGKIAKDGISPTYLEKVREQLRRQQEVDLKENHWWLSSLQEAYYFGEKFEVVSDVDAIVKRVTTDHVKAAAKKFFDPNRYVLGVMKPKQ
jgi:zinc protease